MTATLKQNREFQRAYKKGKYKAGRFLVVYAVPDRKGKNRLGISVGRKFGNSVQRNRIKRLIRESYRKILPGMKKGYDLVFMVRNGKKIAAAQNRKLKAEYVPSYNEIYSESLRLIEKLDLLCLEKLA
ncbi:MAG: ribonuclease P protein component [Clostridia bacterium]|jgi:ribonuclease P protein component|nr:ribonuclease P protein component [Clostridia bacterium]